MISYETASPKQHARDPAHYFANTSKGRRGQARDVLAPGAWGPARQVFKPGMENCFSKSLGASVSLLSMLCARALALPYRRKLSSHDNLKEEQPS